MLRWLHLLFDPSSVAPLDSGGPFGCWCATVTAVYNFVVKKQSESFSDRTLVLFHGNNE